MTEDATLIALLTTIDMTTLNTPAMRKHDGTYLTIEERDLVGTARWCHLTAALDLLNLDVELEGGAA